MQFTTNTAKDPEVLKVKFNFNEEDDSSGVELRFISNEDQFDLYDKSNEDRVEYVVHPSTKKLTRVDSKKYDQDGFTESFIDMLIVSWWGMFLDGEEVECTPENKIKLYKEQKEFAAFVDAKREAINELAVESFGGNSLEGN
jgi:hypothetical protein